ncbi:MAG: hypothetical protein RLZZ415_570 [Pseudomonadota bacterium]
MPESHRTLNRFILLYALAWAGGTIGYVPLLSILLPVQVAGLAGKTAGVDWLAYIALIGAIAASLAGILFGYLSDITRNRRGWIVGGLVLSCVMLPVIGQMNSLPTLVVSIVVWQLGLNMMLGPLAAWAGDVVPDNQKGMLGGLMAFAPGLGALAGALVTVPGLAGGTVRLILVATIVAGCVLPVLLFGAPMQALRSGKRSENLRDQPSHSPVMRMWLARLFVQVAEATLFAYLFLWLISLDPSVSDNQTARLFSLILLVSAPLALLVGGWSDRRGRPIAPLQACAFISAFGLVGMALAPDKMGAMLAYGLFGLSSAMFLALHSAQTLRILPQPDRRARDLGLFNLANTAPSLVMPWLTMALVPWAGFPALFGLLAVLSLAAGLLLRNMPSAS